MKQFTFKKKLIAGTAIAALALGVSGTAFAYWTSAGAGTGTGTAATTSGVALTLHGSFLPATLVPGGSAVVSFTADNASATQSIGVTTIKASSITVPSGSTCDATAFHMADVVENTSIAANALGATLPTSGTITMDNTAVNQDSCKGVAVTLNLVSAAG